jgi:hypothetical protein
MHCRHCKEDMLENKFCLHLTRHVFEKDNAFFLKHVAMYEKGIDKERADPFLEERIVLSAWEVYLLLDFFISNGYVLRRDEPHQDVIFAETLSAYRNSVSRLIPFDQDEWEILREWKSKYLYGLFDYGFQNEKESRELQAFTVCQLLILLHYFAMYGSLFRDHDP